MTYRLVFLALLVQFGALAAGTAHASCEDASKRFIVAVQRGVPMEVLLDQVTREANSEIQQRRARVILDQEKVKFSIERGVAIWKESASTDQLRDYFVQQCKGMLVHWC
jgi:hypothetical protein